MRRGTLALFKRGNQLGQMGSRITVLDLGTHKFTCLIAEWVETEVVDGLPLGALLKVVGFGHQRARGMKAGVLIDLDAAEMAVRDVVAQAENQAGEQVQDLVVAVSCGRLQSLNFSTSVGLSGGAVKQSHIDEVMVAGRDYAAEDGRAVLHLMPLGFALDEVTGVVDPLNLVGDALDLDLHAVTVDVAPLKNIALLLDRCHLQTRRMLASSFASALAVADVSEIELGTTVIDIGGGTTKLALFANGYFVHSDALAIGGDLITYEIAQALNCPLQEAERLKVLYGSVFGGQGKVDGAEKRPLTYSIVGEGQVCEGEIAPEQLADIIRPRVQHILSLVKERLEGSGFGPHSGQRLILTGGCSQLTGIAEFASEIFGKPVRVGGPPALEGLPMEMLSPAFSTSIGLFEGVLAYDLADESLFKAARKVQQGGYWGRMGAWLKESF